MANDSAAQRLSGFHFVGVSATNEKNKLSAIYAPLR